MAQDYIARTTDINGSIESFSVKQYDSGSRALHINLIDRDNPNERTVNLTDHTVTMWCKLPSGRILFFRGIVEDADNGVMCFILDSTITAEAGTVEAEIVISDETSSISMRVFRFEVLPSMQPQTMVV